MNIAPTFLRKKIEDLREAGAPSEVSALRKFSPASGSMNTSAELRDFETRSGTAARWRDVNHFFSLLRTIDEHPAEATKTRQQQRSSPFCGGKDVAVSRCSYR